MSKALRDATLAPIEPPSDLTSLVFAAIRDYITEGTLAPGSIVSEAAMSALLNVSKTPVREALLRLRHIGLVESTSRGVRVIQPSADLVRDAYEHRAGVEALASHYAAQRSTPEEKALILRLADETLVAARQGKTEEFREADREFHLAIAHAARNSVLIREVEDLVVLTQVVRQRDVDLDRDFVVDANEHVAIGKALKKGDADAAGVKMSGHLQRIMNQLLDAISEAGPEDEKDVRKTSS